MDEFSTHTHTTKIGIGGIKFSEELVHIAYQVKLPSDDSLSYLISYITENRINIPFTCAGSGNGQTTNTLCIAVLDFIKVATFFETLGAKVSIDNNRQKTQVLSIDNALIKIIKSIGTLTLFPHRRSFSLVGKIVTILEQAGITVYSYCTSISALAVNIDYNLLDSAVEALDKLVELPENHAPFRPEFAIKQVPAER